MAMENMIAISKEEYAELVAVKVKYECILNLLQNSEYVNKEDILKFLRKVKTTNETKIATD